MLTTVLYNFRIAGEAIFQNKLRAILTSLGIICGVASVIAMLAIGKGAEQEILEKMKLLGTTNIIVKPVDLKKKTQANATDDNTSTNNSNNSANVKEEKQKFTPGLTLKDAENIEALPNIVSVSPEIIIITNAMHSGYKRETNLVGIGTSYFKTNNFNLSQGEFFTRGTVKTSESVCIIGYGIKTKLFAAEDPIGKTIKCGTEWLKIEGVLQEKNITKDNVKNLGIRDYNYDIYIPITTMLLRYVNRSLITKKDMGQSRYVLESEAQQKEPPNPNQLDRLVVQVNNSENVKPMSEVIGRMLQRRHNGVMDFEITVPELLLEQEQNTKRIFNVVLGAIASISLIVGGIGIMNIMLASILERIKEIGVRRAVGAKEKDIMLQFLCEAISISLTGGLIGIIVGIVLSYLIHKFTGINSEVSTFSVFLSFIVSISVGLIFGIMPARRAAKQDPIESLRYE